MYDVAIIGLGPAGYTAVVHASHATLKALIMAGPVGYGRMLMDTTLMENYPDFKDGIQGPDLMGKMRKQARRFGAEVIYEDTTVLDLAGDVKTVTTDDATCQARAVIIAIGSGCRTSDVPGEVGHLGHGVSYCVTCDGFFPKGQPVMVVGGGDPAVEEATYLTNFGPSATLVHRREEFHASKAMQQKTLSDPKIQSKLDRVVGSINGIDKVETVTLYDIMTGKTGMAEVDGLSITVGHIPRAESAHDQLYLGDPDNTWMDPPTTKTSLPGVFTAGDITDTLYRQAAISAGVRCKAVIDVERYLRGLETQAQS